MNGQPEVRLPGGVSTFVDLLLSWEPMGLISPVASKGDEKTEPGGKQIWAHLLAPPLRSWGTWDKMLHPSEPRFLNCKTGKAFYEV